MAFNGSGTFSPYTPGNPVISGATISSVAFNNTIQDIANGLSNAMTRDGQSPPSADIPMSSHKITGLAAATSNGDAVRYEQVAPLAAGKTVAAAGVNTDITSLSGHPVGIMIGQIQTFQTGAVATGTGNIPHDDTIPQNTEGDQFISLSITPQNASSTLEIDVVMVLASSVANPMIAALFQDSTVNALAATDTTFNLAGSAQLVSIKHIMTAGTTSSTTFKVRAGTAVGSGATMTLNGVAGGRLMGGVSASRITIKEYLP